MKLSINSKLTALLAVSALAMTGCQDEEFGYTSSEIQYAMKSEQLIKNLEEALGGKISADQDWNMAMQITANYDLTDLPEGKYNIRIFSEHPSSENAMLLASYYVNSNEAGSIKFDAIKGNPQVYVVVLSENKQLVDSHSMKITAEEVELISYNAMQSRSKTRAAWNPILGTAIDGGTKIYLNNDYIYPVTGLAEGTVSGLTYGDVKSMFVGDDAVFKEEGANGLKYPDLIRDVTFTMKEDGEFKMNLVWAITSNKDAFGYYYKDNAGNYRVFQIFDNIQNEFKIGSTAPASGGAGYLYNGDGDAITSTIYKLAYVDKDNHLSSIFPRGTQIGFFIVQDAYGKPASYQDYNVLYSQKKLNWKVADAAGGAHNLQNTWSAYYKYEGKLYLGFEDWKEVRDNDYNDIVFYIDAPVEEDDDASLDLTPETLTEDLWNDDRAAIWTLAFEDLGNTFDFDFNDVVLQFKHASGSENVDVILAAAGGTLKANLLYKGVELGSEVHSAFGVESNIPVNVNAPTGSTKVAIEAFATAEVSSGEFTMTDLSAFTLHVIYSEGENGEELTAADLPFGEAYTKDRGSKAPQCLIIPGRWCWPNESEQVYEAYSNFKTWATTWQAKENWSEMLEDNNIDKASWYKNNYNRALLYKDPASYYTETIGGTSGEKVEVDAGLVTYHVQLNRIGAAKYYGGKLNIQITDWKTDFSTKEDYDKVVLKGIQTGNTFTLDVPSDASLSEPQLTEVNGLTYKVTVTGSDATKVVDIEIDLSSAAAAKLLGNPAAENTNDNNNKFDVSAYASTCSALIVANNRPNDYSGPEVPDIDADDQNIYPYDVIVPTGENIVDCQQYITTAAEKKITLPNGLFDGNRRMKIHIEYGSTVTMSRMYGSNYLPDVPLTYGANSFTLTTDQVNAIYNNGAGLTLGFALNGVDQTKFVRAMWIEYCAADPNLTVSSSLSIEEEETKTVTASYEGNGRMTAIVIEGESNLQIVSVEGKDIQVKGLATGTAKILVSVDQDGNSYDSDSKEIEVTVNAVVVDLRPEPTISISDLNIEIGSHRLLSASSDNTDSQAFTYSIKEGSSVTLSNGVVTAVAQGKTVITVTESATTNFKAASTDFEINVVKPEISEAYVQLNGTQSANYDKYSIDVTNFASIYPYGASLHIRLNEELGTDGKFTVKNKWTNLIKSDVSVATGKSDYTMELSLSDITSISNSGGLSIEGLDVISVWIKAYTLEDASGQSISTFTNNCVSISGISEALGTLNDNDIIQVTFVLSSASNLSGYAVGTSDDVNSSTDLGGADYSGASTYVKDFTWSAIKNGSYLFIKPYYNVTITNLYVKKK